MNKYFPSEFTSSFDLINLLKEKYDQNSPQFSTKNRFPASLIFFSSKREYKIFLEQAPWEFHQLSNIFINDKIPSEIKANKWIKDALLASQNKPIVLVPITEYIRFYSSSEISILFNKILQSERSKIIVPMLDFYQKYLSFIDKYFHKTRMADVFLHKGSNDEIDTDIEIIFDNTGKILAASYDIIKDPKDWILLWENGEIAIKNKLLVQNKKIIEIVEKSDITVPKIKRHTINSFGEYLQFEYSIHKSVLKIEPTPEILNYIISKGSQLKGQQNWIEFEKQIIGDNTELENKIYKFWENNQNENNTIKRWFWLNKAKSLQFNKKILNDIILDITNPEILLDEIYLLGCNPSIIDGGILSQRRDILLHFSNPLFTKDTLTFEEKFNQMKNFIGNDPSHIIQRITGLFDFERKTLVEIVPELFRCQKGLSKNHFLILRKTWPEFAEYIEPALNLESIDSFNVTDEFSKFVKIYLSHYIYSKVFYDLPTEELEKLQNGFRKQWNSINAGLITGKIQTHINGILPSEIKDIRYIFLDGVGYEWGKVIHFLFENLGWQVLDITPIFAALPTTTEFFPLEMVEGGKPIEKIDSFDRMIHESYEYPYTIEKELQMLKEIVDIKIHKKYKGYSQPIWIISDHGTTVFARKGSSLKNFKDEDKKHGGRYGKLSQRSFSETDELKLIDGEKRFIISLTYDNLGKTCPRGEAHGGATPEETLAFAIKVAPPAIRQPTISLVLTINNMEVSLLDEEIKMPIEGNYPFPITNIKLIINKSPRFSIDMQYYSQRTLILSISFLRQKGLIIGENELNFIFNNTIQTTCIIKLTSGSEETGFDKRFRF